MKPAERHEEDELPGQPEPSLVSSGTVTAGERQIYGWLWRNYPKVVIPYRYA